MEANFDNQFMEDAPPEISSTDLSPTMLFLADWGCTTVQEVLEELPFVDPPDRAALEKSIQLLVDLQALEQRNGEGDRCSITFAWSGNIIAKIIFRPIQGLQRISFGRHPTTQS
jgi:HrpA-like RNA helicase